MGRMCLLHRQERCFLRHRLAWNEIWEEEGVTYLGASSGFSGQIPNVAKIVASLNSSGKSIVSTFLIHSRYPQIRMSVNFLPQRSPGQGSNADFMLDIVLILNSSQAAMNQATAPSPASHLCALGPLRMTSLDKTKTHVPLRFFLSSSPLNPNNPWL